VTKILDEDALYRRLAESQINTADGSVNSSAFKRDNEYENAISVDLARLTTPQESVDRAPRAGFRLGVIVTKAAKSIGFDVEPDALPDNPAHCLIKGENNKQRSRALARAMKVLPSVVSRDR
jgi:hypothetical protein